MACCAKTGSQDHIQCHRLKMCQRLIKFTRLPGVGAVDDLVDQLPCGNQRHHLTQPWHKEGSGVERIETNALPIRQALLFRRFVGFCTGHRQVAGIGLDALQLMVLHIAKQFAVDRHIPQVQIGAVVDLAIGIQRFIYPFEEMRLLMLGYKTPKQLPVSGRKQMDPQIHLERCHRVVLFERIQGSARQVDDDWFDFVAGHPVGTEHQNPVKG
ncbi:hypothetical protein D3C77_346540 [compost metagenome]